MPRRREEAGSVTDRRLASKDKKAEEYILKTFGQMLTFPVSVQNS
jgi:hypothetical protein